MRRAAAIQKAEHDEEKSKREQLSYLSKDTIIIHPYCWLALVGICDIEQKRKEQHVSWTYMSENAIKTDPDRACPWVVSLMLSVRFVRDCAYHKAK